MGKATDILAKRKKYGSTYVNAEFDTSKSSSSASDILNNRRINKYRDELSSIDIKFLYDYKDFGLSEDKKKEYKTTISKYKTALENLKKYDSSIKDEDYNKSLESINLLSDKFDFLSSYKSEDDYNDAVKKREEYESWKNADTKALKTEIEGLENTYNSYIGIKSKRDDLYSTLVSGYMRAGHTKEKAEKAALSDGRIAKFDKELSQYGNMSDSAKTLSEKKQFLNNAKRIQEGIALQENALNAEDFDKYSKSGADIENPTFDEVKSHFWLPSGVKKVKNKVTYSRGNYEEALDYETSNSDHQPDTTKYGVNSLYTKMTDEEVAIYNYYLSKEGEEKADQFLNSITESLNYRQAEDEFENAYKDNATLEYIFGLGAGLDQWASGVKSLFNTEGEYIPQTSTQMLSGMIRNDLSEDGKVAQGAYDLITTTGNMLPSILVGQLTGGLLAGAGYVNAAGKLTKGADAVSKLAGAATLGASAAGNGYQEMLNLGYDKSQAKAYGTLVGVSEAGLEYVLGGISSLGGTVSGGITNKAVTKLISNYDNAIAKLAISAGSKAAISAGGKMVIGAGGKLLGSLVSEFGEEYLQEVLDPVFKNITLKTDEDIKLFSTEALYSGILGALSAGLLEGGSSISGEVATYKAGKDVKKAEQLSNLKKLGTSFSADTVAYKIASQVNENTDAYTIGQLLHEVGADSLSEANIADITKSLERKGISPEHAQTIAKWLNSAVMGENFSPLQRMALKNPDISQTFKDVIVNQNSTVNQRMQSYTDILQSIANEKVTQKAKNTKAKAEKKANNKSKTTEEAKTTPFIPYSSEEIARRQSVGEVVVDSEGKSITDSKNALENKFETNLDGKTLNTKTGDSVNVAEIASINNGKMTLKLDNGETVDADDISFGTEDEGLIYSTVLDMGVNAAVANSLVKNYNPSDNLSAKKYAMGIKEAYKYGSYGMPVNEMSKKGFAADLSEAQRTHAYNLGKADTAAKIEKAQKEVEKVASGKGGFEGKVHFKGDTLALKEVQRESLKRMGVLSEVLGVDFHVFESYVVNGKRVFKDADGKVKSAPNGYYKDGKIYIDLNAGKDGQGIMIYTVAHELTHWIREWSPAKFKILADFLFEQYGEKGHSVNDLVQAQIDKAKRNGRTIDFDTAYEEVVADSMETMLSDDKVFEKILELKSKDASIVKKIGEFFAKIIDGFKKMMQQYPPETPEGKLVSQMNDSFAKIQELFAEALVDASNNYQANEGQKTTTSEGDVIKFSLMNRNTFESNVDAILSMNDNDALLNAKEGNFIRILDETPRIITDNVKDAENHEVIISFYSLYLATRKSGALEGHYHNLGDLVKNLPEYISNPQAIVKMNSGRLNLFTQIKTPKGENGILSIELNSTKDINNKFDKYNLVITVYSANDNHTKNNIVNNGIKVEYEKEDLMQVNPQLCKWLAIINKKSSEGSIPQTSKKSQEKQSGRDNMIGERNLEDFAEAKDTEGKTLFQYRAMESDEDVYREMLKTTKIMNDAEIDSLFDTIDRAMDIIKDNLEILDYAWESDIDDRAFNPVKPNSDSLYQVSVDFSTLCRKRLLQQAIQIQLQEALDKPLTREEGIAIRDALLTIQEEGRKIEVACALCYVESARMKSPAQIKKFLETREKVLKEFFATKSGGDIKGKIKQAEIDVREKFHKENPNGIKGKDGTMLDPRTAPLKAMPKKYADPIRDAKRAAKESYIPTAKEQEIIDVAKRMTISDFTSPEGLENLAKYHSQLFDAYTSYVRNATKSKGIEGDTWWRAGDSQSIGDTLIDNMNAENGLRSQSWSDFQVIHLLDYMAATIELSTRKAKMQAYTKVPDFVELMGNTGEMINLSLIPTRHFNGVLEFDSVEGMAFEESLRLRDKYHATAGTIAIGIDNKQIQMLLADSKIDYVIPYHKSGMAASVRKLMHMPTWSEYEDYQSEKNLSREDAKRQAKKYGVKLLSESDSNYHKHPNFSDWFDIKEARQIAKLENSNPSDKAMAKKYGVMYGGYMAMQNAANNYLKLCAERGISPKFSHEKADFTVEDNYWKLLIDRKMIDNVTGEVIEQQAVKPIFDQTEVLRILNDELERYSSVKADQDYATRKVTENFLSGNIKGGMSAEAIAKAMKKPVDNVAKVNILASVEDSKLSDRDTAYMDAVNNGDMETAQRLVDEAAKEAGHTVKGYHGTGEDFNIFSEDKISGRNVWGKGYYFGTSKGIADDYASLRASKGGKYRIVNAALKMDNPFTPHKSSIGTAKEILDTWFSDMWKNSKELGLGYIQGKLDNSPLDLLQFIAEHNNIEVRDVLKKYGYDSIKDGGELVVFDSNQIKSADPVTYDDNGNVIPLFERFNPENDDIRCSDRDSEGNELSKEQQDFFANSKVRDENGNLLMVYHGSPKGNTTIFDKSKTSKDNDMGQGLYFSTNISDANEYRRKTNAGDMGKSYRGKIYSAYVNIENPFVVSESEYISLPNALNLLKLCEDRMVAKDVWYGLSINAKDGYVTTSQLANSNISTYMTDILAKSNKYDGIIDETVSSKFGLKEGTKHIVALNSNQIKETTNTNPTSNPDIRYSERVTDEETLDFLNEQIEKGEYIKVYRSFQVIDGGLYAPMNAVDRDENGKNKRLGYRSEYGVWEKSTESPEIAQRYMDSHPEAPYAKFDLDGVDNKTNAVAYNPYFHASNLVLNDQFAAAYRRKLITVECYVPLSEANGTYKAQYAKDATGWVDWKAGGVAGKLLKVKPEYTRKLFVSRYMLPVRQVSDSEVAAMYKEYLDGTDIAVPWNVVTPSLRNELEKAGVNISYEDVKAGSKTISFNDVFSDDVKLSERDSDAAENIKKINDQLAKENVKLIEDVKYLKELVKLQGKETHGKMLKKSTVELVAKRLMAYSNAKGNTSELVGYLTDVYSYIAQGEDVSWEGIQEKSQAAVDWLMQNESHKPVRDEYADSILKELRTMRVSLDDTQKKEVAYYYGSFNNFRKKNMGRIIITNDGISLDSAWQELAEMHPAYFDKEANSADQPIILMDIIDGLQNSYAEDEYHYYSDEMIAQDLMTKVYEGYWDVSALHTVADAKQKEINLLKAKHKERMDALRKTHSDNEAKLRQEHKDRVSKLRTQYREREENKIKKVAEYYQKSRKEAVDRVKESREKRDAITKLQRLVLDTAKWVSYPKKDDVKCPDIIRGPYAEFLSSIDLSSKRLLNGGEPTQNDLRVASAMDSLAKAIEKKLGTQSPDTETETVLDTGYLDLPVHFVDNLKELSEDLKKRMASDGHIVNAMTSEEIKTLTKFIKTLNHSIKEMSTLYSNMRFAKVEQLGSDTMLFLKYLGETKQSNSIVNFVTWDNALPYYTFKRFGVGGESVFEELMDAQDKLAYLADQIFKFKEKTWTDKEASEWSKDTHTIKLPSGRELTLTSSDAMSIYCLSRREQGKQHLLGGGVRVLGIEKNGKKTNDSRSLLNQQDILAIASSLTERQKQVAEAIQEYMSTVCAEWGNEISMKRFLTKEFTENYYFPIESNDENLDTKDPKAQQSDLYRLLNISATKPLTKGANNEVIIRNVFDVFTGHSSDMARLNAYGMALLDYMKWINYRVKTMNDEGQISVSGVRKSMEKAYGPEAKKYVIGLIKDINGRANDGGDHPFLMKMTRTAKTAMVGANLRVSLLQFTAYPRAAMVLSNKSLALGLTKVPQIEKAKKYCGIALWKSFGFYDTNISRSIEDQIKGATNIRQKIIELSLKGAEWGDAITWGCLWNACEYEVAKTNQYKVGSEEFNEAVGKKLREVVYATQVVDSTLTRSQMMRNKSGLTQSASAFMSEPTLSANILMDAGFQFNLEKRRTGSAKLAWKKTGKYIGKAVAVYSIGQIIAALAEALADAYRDDDDEELKKKFGEAFKENVISDLNPFNKIPLISDVSDLILSCFGIGFSSSNSLYLQAINEASNAFETWQKVINGEDGKTVYAGIYSTTKVLSYITGVSASGAMREVVTLWNNTAGAADPYLKIRTYESSATDKGIAEYKFDKGDTTSVKTTVSKMIEEKVKSGKTEKEAKSAVRSSFTSTYKSEYMEAAKNKDFDEMNRIRKFLYATGLYGTLSELDETLKKWRTSE